MEAPGRIGELDDRALLELRLRDLPRFGLSLRNAPVTPYLRRIEAELRRRRVPLKPFFWVSDEWFCPDGVGGIAVPFYLLHPRLIALEIAQVGTAEGATADEAMPILRHEAGHALENAFGIRMGGRRRALFGDSEVPYPKSYAPKPYSRKFVRHLPFHYAQSHPDEDFAETFAVWLTPGSRWREKYAGWAALEKLQFVDQTMRALRGYPTRRRGDALLPLEQLSQTLGEHYAKKKRTYRLDPGDSIGFALARMFPPSGGGMTAERYFRRMKVSVRRELASRASHPLYQIDSVLSALEWRLRKLELRVPGRRTDGAFLTRRFVALSERCLRRGHHRIPI